jgi:hypothetical protein
VAVLPRKAWRPMSTGRSVSESDGKQAGSPLLEISTEIVRVFKDQFGRGPTKARASWTTPDVLTVVLEDTFTPAERNLAAMGEHERLRNMRSFFQYAAVPDFCGPNQRNTRRRVRAFISGIDTVANGLAVETFVLYPEGSDEDSRMARADGAGGFRASKD